MKKDKNKKTISSPKSFFCSVGEHIDEKVDNHIRALKFLNKNIKKREWIAEALKEKLEIEDNTSFDNIPRMRHYSIPLPEDLRKQLDQRIAFIKKYRPFSTKQLLIEAIFDKLEREVAKTREMIEMKQKPRKK